MNLEFLEKRINTQINLKIVNHKKQNKNPTKDIVDDIFLILENNGKSVR